MIGENGLFFFGVGRFAGFQTAFLGVETACAALGVAHPADDPACAFEYGA
jgi:hypothetical protein